MNALCKIKEHKRAYSSAGRAVTLDLVTVL